MGPYRRLDDGTLPTFLRTEKAALVIGRTDCGNCAPYDAAVTEVSLGASASGIAFGRLVLDEPGLARFKRENAWLGEIDVLPYTVLYRNGARLDGFACANRRCLEERLEDAGFLQGTER